MVFVFDLDIARELIIVVLWCINNDYERIGVSVFL